MAKAIGHRVLEFPLIDLPMVLAINTRGAVAGLVELGMTPEYAVDFVTTISPDHASGWATLVKTPEGQVICALMVSPKNNRNVVAHECTHIAVMALDWASIEYTADSHEILAMSVGWLVEKHSEPWRTILEADT